MGARSVSTPILSIHPDAHTLNRKFWQENLPRIKYHNPSLPVIVNRHSEQAQHPLLTIYVRKPDTTAPATRSQPASSRDNLSKATQPDADERIIQFDMKDKHSNNILEYFLAETRAVVLQPTPDEIKELQEIEALRKQAEVDRERVKKLREEKKREEDMLKRARAAGGVAEEEEA